MTPRQVAQNIANASGFPIDEMGYGFFLRNDAIDAASEKLGSAVVEGLITGQNHIETEKGIYIE